MVLEKEVLGKAEVEKLREDEEEEDGEEEEESEPGCPMHVDKLYQKFSSPTHPSPSPPPQLPPLVKEDKVRGPCLSLALLLVLSRDS